MIPQPDIRPIEDGKYRLAATYVLDYKGVTFKIRKGMIHDGASVPRLAWTISGLRPDGLLRAAALIHDALYQNLGELPEGWALPARSFTRKEADRAFYDIMRAAGLSRYRSWIAYRAVRIGGWVSWRKHARAAQSAA